jgi:hypothetical protein
LGSGGGGGNINICDAQVESEKLEKVLGYYFLVDYIVTDTC